VGTELAKTNLVVLVDIRQMAISYLWKANQVRGNATGEITHNDRIHADDYNVPIPTMQDCMAPARSDRLSWESFVATCRATLIVE
jgi:hypothetical protein